MRPAGPPPDHSEAPQQHERVRRLLRDQGLDVERVIRVDDDSVLYVTAAMRPRTAWLHLDAPELVTHDESGFSAQRPDAGPS